MKKRSKLYKRTLTILLALTLVLTGLPFGITEASGVYIPGNLLISVPAADSSAVSYKLTDGFINNTFNVMYRTAVGGFTSKTVLVVDLPEYGMEWNSTISSESNPNVVAAVKVSPTTYVVQLVDGKTGDISIDFSTKFRPLTLQQCETWLDEGSLPDTNFRVREYEFKGSDLAGILSDGVSILQTNQIKFFGSDISLANTAAETAAAPNTYSVGVSPDSLLANVMMGEKGYGKAAGNDGVYMYPGPKDPNLRYSVPTVHSSDTPLMEITSIKVYAPNDNFKLTGLSNNPSTQSSIINNSHYYSIWKNWDISAPQNDGAGRYYLITPPAGTRVFNNGTAEKQGTLYYGMRLLWGLESGYTLPASESAYTVLQNATPSELNYKTPSGSPVPTLKRLEHDSPKVSVYIKKQVYPTSAYNQTRGKENVPNNNVIVGSIKNDEVFSYLTNAWHRSAAGGSVIENFPVGNGANTQTYTFPAAIRPLDISFAEAYQKTNPDFRNTVLQSLSYTTLDGNVHDAAPAEIAAVNNYFSAPGSVPPVKLQFSHADDSNRVSAVEVKWTSLYTGAYDTYGRHTLPFYNKPLSGKIRNLSGTQSNLITSFSYKVSAADDAGNPLEQYSMHQVQYSVDFVDPGHTDVSNGAESPWLWFRLTVPPCPSFFTEAKGTTAFRDARYADGASSYSVGHLGVNTGAYGEREDIMKNPVIDFRTVFNNSGLKYNDATINNLTGISENEGIAFLSGAFTAMPRLSGWVFTYSTNLRTDATYTVPAVSNPAGEAQQIPLSEGEYFTALSLKYNGDFDTAHADETDTSVSFYIIKDIMMKALKVNPATAAAINTANPYTSAFIQLRARAKWDNCVEAGTPHAGFHEVFFDGYNKGASARKPPQMGIYFTRQAELYACPSPAVLLESSPVPSVYQGSGSTAKLYFSMSARVTNPGEIGTYANEGQYNHFPADGTPYPAGTVFPFKDTSEAVYIELTDPEVVPDVASASLYGVPVSSGNVEASIVSAGGKSFLKLKFADGFDRPVYHMPYHNNNGSTRPAHSGWFTIYGDWYNAAGPVNVSFTTLPSCSEGLHYPIGDIYLDFSDLLSNYDAPDSPTGYDLERTNWLIAGNADNSALTGSTAPDTNQLFKFNFGSASASPYKINVIKLTSSGADHFPGKYSTYDYTPARQISFNPSERNGLGDLVTIIGSDSTTQYDMETFISVPKAGVSVSYFDDEGNPNTALSELGMTLTGAPVTIHDGTGIPGNISVAYTTDANPGEGSSYTDTEPADEAAWAAVTGLRIRLNQMPPLSSATLRIPYSAPVKTTFGDSTAYSSGSSRYRTSPGGEFHKSGLRLIRWTYTDLLVTRPEKGTVFWDTWDENGIKSANPATGETGVPGVRVELLDTDGITVIHSAITDAEGRFTLKTYKSDAGQIVRIDMPTDLGMDVKLTKKSDDHMAASGADSDFDRATRTIVLPAIPPGGFNNMSAGLIKLPVISMPDVSLNLQTDPTKNIRAGLTEYYGNELPATSYRFIYSAAADAAVVTIPPTTVTDNSAYITATGLKAGTTTATVKLLNTLGDEVSAVYNIRVIDQSYKAEHYKQLDDGSWSLVGADTDTITDIAPGAAATFSPKTYTGWSYNNALTTYEDATHIAAATPLPVSDDGSLIIKLYYEKTTIDVGGNKTWLNMDDYPGGSYPTATIKLWRNNPSPAPGDIPYRTLNITGGASSYKFTALPEYDDDGVKYSYTVSEANMPHFIQTQSGNDFTNTYSPVPGSYTVPTVNKKIIGPVRPASFLKDFTFILKGSAGAPMPPGSIGQTKTLTLSDDGSFLFSGTVEFGSISYTSGGLAATPKVYTYTVEEVDGGVPAYSYSSLKYTVTVSVVDTDGVISASALIDDGSGIVPSIKFDNRYVPAPASLPVPVLINTVSGEPDPSPESFSFTLTGSPGDPMPAGSSGNTKEGSVTGAGNFDFGSISFSAAGTYSYTITETPGTAAGWIYNSDSDGNFLGKSYSYTVTVTDTGGVLSAVGVLKDEADNAAANPVFNNHYKPLPGTYTIPMVTKILGGVPDPHDNTFSFTLTGSPGAPMPAGSIGMSKKLSVTGAGTVSFGNIKYTAGGTAGSPLVYSYTIKETSPEETAYTNSTKIYTITVSAVDTGGNIIISSTVKDEDGNDAASIQFTNVYAPAPVYLSPSATKLLAGVPDPHAEEFSFELKENAPGNPMPSGSISGIKTASVTGAGKAPFGAIKFDRQGVYSYTISEVAGALTGYSYNTDSSGAPLGRTYTYIVRVTDTAGVLSTAETLTDNDGNPAAKAEFYNFYAPTPISPATPSIEKQLSGSPAPSVKRFDFSIKAVSTTAVGLTPATMPRPAFTSKFINGAGVIAANAFGNISFDRAGSYVYSISEDDFPAFGYEGYTKGGEIYLFTVTVTDTAGVLSASSSLSCSGNPASSAVFVNKYLPAAVSVLEPAVEKVLTGDADHPSLNFEFEMRAQSYTAPAYSSETLTPAEMPMPAGSAAGVKTVIGGEGNVHFGGFSFTKPGVYVYTVKELAGTDPFTSYDGKTYTFSYTVVDTAGALGSTLVISEPFTFPDPDKAVFTNNYVRPFGKLTVSKTVSGADAGPTLFTFYLNFSEGGTYSYSGDHSGTIGDGGTINLMHGEKVTIMVPYGVNYTVVEALVTGFTTSPASRTFTGTIGATDSIANYINFFAGSGSSVPPPGTPVPPHIHKPGEGTGDLIVKNTITGEYADKEQSFTFTINFSDGGAYLYDGSKAGVIKSGEKVQLKDGESIHIEGIPAGVRYTVTISGNEGYRTHSSGASGVIEKGKTKIASFVSSKSSVPATGDDCSILAGLVMMMTAALGIAVIEKRESDRRRRRKGKAFSVRRSAG